MVDVEFYVIEESQDGFRGGGGEVKWDTLNKDKLKENLLALSTYLGEALVPLADAVSGFQASEVELGLQISAEGKIGFLGSGAKSGGNASIKVKFIKK